MDPNAALKDLLDTLAEAGGRKLTKDERVELMEKLADLHEWLRKGGFPPTVVKRIDGMGESYGIGIGRI